LNDDVPVCPNCNVELTMRKRRWWRKQHWICPVCSRMFLDKELERFNELYDAIPNEVIPKYCPNCSEKLIRITDKGLIWVMPCGESYKKIHLKITTFDVYCGECEWSGDISPDTPEDIIIWREED
jgi:predicted RNA-binding Zn-ribbon protein involved in translation (DUF1610 family)